MDFDEMRAAFFAPAPPDQPAPGSDAHDHPARWLRDALEPLATVVFWSRPAHDALARLGLDFLAGYVGARAAPLGQVPAPVVAAAFGVFEPGLVAALHAQAAAAAPREAVLAARRHGSAAALRETLGPEPGEPAALAAALRAGIGAADLAARPLFAASTALDWPQDPHEALWHAAASLRELRGDAHLAACTTVGLTGLQMNVLTERWVGYAPGAYSLTRGWSAEQLAAATAELTALGLLEGPGLSDAGLLLRRQLEDATDLALAPTLAALGPGLGELTARLAGFSAQLVAAGVVPPDPYKRAAG